MCVCARARMFLLIAERFGCGNSTAYKEQVCRERERERERERVCVYVCDVFVCV